jgi:hypothetical protein
MKSKSMSRLMTLVLSLFLAGSASAAPAWWSANAATAVPHFQADSTLRSRTFDLGLNGRGVRHANNQIGSVYLYVPVTANNGDTFSKIGLRAEDSTVNGFVRAELFRQPRNAVAGGAVLIGSVTTNNAGFQFVNAAFFAAFLPHSLDLTQFTYYIRITLQRNVAADTVTALDVSLEP